MQIIGFLWVQETCPSSSHKNYIFISSRKEVQCLPLQQHGWKSHAHWSWQLAKIVVVRVGSQSLAPYLSWQEEGAQAPQPAVDTLTVGAQILPRFVVRTWKVLQGGHCRSHIAVLEQLQTGVLKEGRSALPPLHAAKAGDWPPLDLLWLQLPPSPLHPQLHLVPEPNIREGDIYESAEQSPEQHFWRFHENECSHNLRRIAHKASAHHLPHK